MAAGRGKESEEAEVFESSGEAEDVGGRLGALPELMRKAFAAGFSSFFVTEEAIRKALGETLPKDWSDFAVEQSTRTRAEFLERLSYEIARSLEAVDLATVLTELLEGRTLEVKAEIRLGPKQAGSSARPLQVKVAGGDAGK